MRRRRSVRQAGAPPSGSCQAWPVPFCSGAIVHIPVRLTWRPLRIAWMHAHEINVVGFSATALFDSVKRANSRQITVYGLYKRPKNS
ncbi:conserved hypothetical protein [Mesorhizobium prunaredense]|uniref:Uncharacterized protein n=1 Tax=Mesorhizobium prunaredense TaxID=1631249 RepID=A0A1R3V4G8_9HYPH|nr:conserved hypothetical protein [Mesorhizobium prunaredense]